MYKSGEPPKPSRRGDAEVQTQETTQVQPGKGQDFRHIMEDLRPIHVRKIDAALKRASERPTSPPGLTVCDPLGDHDGKLHDYLLTIEPALMEFARTHGDIDVSVICLDKSRQNPINNLGGRKGAGDSAMQTYWEMVDRAANLLRSMTDTELVSLDLIRVSPTSDEGITILAGRNLPSDISTRFSRALSMAKKELNLRGKEYNVVIDADNHPEAFNLDLDAFSRVLKHPEVVTSCKYTMSPPRQLGKDEREGFIMDEIRTEENHEIAFYPLLPDEFRVIGDGRAEVRSPFPTNLYREEAAIVWGGYFVEIKLEIPGNICTQLLRFTEDGKEGGIAWEGTRKGYSELFSGVGGMRILNTMFGKARANEVLTPIAEAMGEIESKYTSVIPLNGGYLQYWVDALPSGGSVEELVRTTVQRHMGEAGSLPFKPVVTVLDASEYKVPEARAAFILESMGKRECPPQLLDKTDFLLNFIENINPKVQHQIYQTLTMGPNHIRISDLARMQQLRRICSSRRTIRDTEDLVWKLRKDPVNHLGADDSKKKELEEWLFDFSWEHADRIFKALTQRIQREMIGRDSSS